MANLKFDPVVIETDLGKNYLKKYNDFKAWPAAGKFWNVKKYPYKLREYDNNENPDLKDQAQSDEPPACIAKRIAEKINNLRSTFIQLEYLIRKTDQEDANNNINLIIQHLQCPDETWNSAFKIKMNILITEETPLYALGYVASAIRVNSVTVNIVTTQKMAPVCNLFSNICKQKGWKVPLIFVNSIEEYLDGQDANERDDLDDEIDWVNVDIKVGACGCTGVVTESADIDSAVDLFINSSSTTSWKLQRIYVQESIYEEVKIAFASRFTSGLVSSCAGGFVTKGKIFFYGPSQFRSKVSTDGEKASVPMEAYRTTTELNALLAQHPTSYLSLWAADSQVANEVMLSTSASTVWINEYATFYGPPISSLPVYEATYPRVPFVINENTLKSVIKLSQDWEKLTKNKRIDLTINTLQNILNFTYDTEERRFLAQLQSNILRWKNDSFVSVDNAQNRICYSIEVPPEVDEITVVDLESSSPYVNSIIAAINDGRVIYSHAYLDDDDVLDSLRKAGVPVMGSNDEDPTKTIKVSLLNKKLKVVRTNMGTIYAN